MTGKNQHVIPSGDRWAVRRVGASRSSGVYDTLAEAINAARGIARNQRSEVFIHDLNGRIREHESFGKTPVKAEG